MKPALLLNISDYARAARAKLSREVFDYYEGGALDEITLRENVAGWERLKLYYRVLAGVGARSTNSLAIRARSQRHARPKPPAHYSF
jgi:isopentenyl diphosphate isomerase/L-lactate dehydrogenase-like FMN-dependent dehydrogenase